MPITYGPRWGQAQSTMVEAVADYMKKVIDVAKTALQRLPGFPLIGSPEAQMQVYVSLTEHWVACTSRDVVLARSRRTVKHQLLVKTLKSLANEGIQIASPRLTLMRYLAERMLKEEA